MENKAKVVNAKLMNHCGAEVVTRQQLAKMKTAEGTDTHITIPHIELVEKLERILTVNHLKIQTEQFSVMSDGNKLFGVMSLTGMDVTEYRMALGLRASNDKKFPVQMIVGANIFVCDNLCFNGEIICTNRRHTKYIDIISELEEGVQKAIVGYRGTATLIDSWKSQEISDDRAKALILDAGIDKVMPLHLVSDVRNEYFNPKHEEFAPRTVWSLHNAFTECFKLLKPHVAMDAATDLAKYLTRERIGA